MKLKPDWFLIGMIAATVLAWAAPEPGAAGGWMHPELVTKAGVALIFFLHGVALSFGAMRAGVLNWRLHLLVQGFTFLVFPLIGFALMVALDGRVAPDLKLGLFYLCALPSTVSSSVAMTATARGNVAGAVFNATLSSLIGIFLTPLWIAVVMKTSGQSVPLGPVILDLLRWLVLPLAVGQALHPWLGGLAARHKAKIGLVDRGTILLLVYTSFCDSFKEGIWSGHGGGQVLLVGLVCAALFAFVMVLTASAARALGFAREDRMAAIFCGSKKTLASGVPMAKLIFAAHPGLGLILLPIMIYHPLQLIVCGVLAARWGRALDD
ncbi:MAG: bile acid:sodium symporter [Verrucomicrobia bacterium]|nr:bile acid:sodium symporter [Verrucomicrobiota bacterium]